MSGILILENVIMGNNPDCHQNPQDPNKNVANFTVYDNHADGSSQTYRFAAWGNNAKMIAEGMKKGEFLKGCRITLIIGTAPVESPYTIKNGPNAGQQKTSLQSTMYYARSMSAQQNRSDTNSGNAAQQSWNNQSNGALDSGFSDCYNGMNGQIPDNDLNYSNYNSNYNSYNNQAPQPDTNSAPRNNNSSGSGNGYYNYSTGQNSRVNLPNRPQSGQPSGGYHPASRN